MYYLINPYICVMSSKSRITQSKGEPEAVSLPSRTRQCKKSTTMDDQQFRPTSSQSTVSPTTPAEDTHGEGRCQSTPPQDQQVRMWETPVSAFQPGPARPLMPRVPLPKSQDSGSHLSQMSAPLFTEDRCNTSSEDETAACDVEVTFINDRRTPSRATTVPFSPG